MTARIGVVVVAAGLGTRLGCEGPKALVPLAGRSMLVHALEGLAAAGLPPAVVVHTPGERAAFVSALGGVPVAELVPGGASRTASVRAGLAALPEAVELVVVHDAARPLMPAAVIRATVDVVVDGGDVVAAAPALPVSDTLKRRLGDTVVGTVDREDLVGVQTPQVLPRPIFERALASGEDATDDLGLIEARIAAGELEGRVVVVPGSAWGRKVTYASDLELLEALASMDPSAAHEPQERV